MMILIFSVLGAQKKIDSIQIKDVQDFRVDDYRYMYLYQDKNFSLTKVDFNGRELGRLMMTVPFTIQSIDNPLNIFLFSENAQEIKVIDQNLIEIQKVDLRQYFGFIKMAYVEDLQQAWLLDETTKRLIQYNYRSNQVIKSFQYTFDFNEVNSMLVFDQKLYITTNYAFMVYDLRGNVLFSKKLENLKKMSRDNDRINVIGLNEIYQFKFPTDFKSMFFDQDAKIVDKNSSSYFVLKENKGYIYILEK